MLVRSLNKLTTFNLNCCKRFSISTKLCLKPELGEVTYKKHDKMPKENHEGFNIVYRCKAVNLVGALSRLKIYQTVFFVAGTPMAYALSFAGQMEIPTANSIALVGGVAMATLMYFSYVTRRLIGLIWYNNDKDLVKIAYLSFWGQRKDMTVPISLIPLFDDPTQNYLKPLVKLKLLNSPNFFFISLRYGIVWNESMFQKLFSKHALEQYKLHQKLRGNPHENHD